jgi:hypothetical protein
VRRDPALVRRRDEIVGAAVARARVDEEKGESRQSGLEWQRA